MDLEMKIIILVCFLVYGNNELTHLQKNMQIYTIHLFLL